MSSVVLELARPAWIGLQMRPAKRIGLNMAMILLVDDEIEFRRLLLNVLTLEKHTVFCAGDGNEAIRLFLEHSFDLVITDLIMPEKEGLETIMELHRYRPAVKIIAMTGGGYNCASTYLTLARAFGVKQTLMKPFTRDQILNAVSTTLEPVSVS